MQMLRPLASRDKHVARSRMIARPFALATLMAAALSLHSPVAIAGKSDDTLKIAFSNEIETLDSYLMVTREGLIMARQLFDSLLDKDVLTGKFHPALAESWKMVDDLTIDFKLRQGVKFHDGDELTADDVVFTYNTVIKAEYGAKYRDFVE